MSEEVTNENPNDEQQSQQVDPAEKPLGENGEKALRAEREARKAAEKAASDYKAKLDEIEQASLSDLERAQQEAKDATSRLAELERQSLIQRVAIEKGVPANLVDRLRGDTEDDITADADALMALVNAPKSPRPDPTQGGRGEGTQSTGDQFANAVKGLFN